jgi:hypothetical protein
MDLRRERLIAAYRNRQAAKRAYRDEASRYVVAWFGDQGPDHQPEAITRDALKRLRKLSAAVDATQREYEVIAKGPAGAGGSTSPHWGRHAINSKG